VLKIIEEARYKDILEPGLCPGFQAWEQITCLCGTKVLLSGYLNAVSRSHKRCSNAR
jgi:hypothetical protein